MTDTVSTGGGVEADEEKAAIHQEISKYYKLMSWVAICGCMQAGIHLLGLVIKPPNHLYLEQHAEIYPGRHPVPHCSQVLVLAIVQYRLER